MRIELWIVLITGIVMYDTYYENKYSKMILSYKKYYKIILIGLTGIFIYYLFKNKPDQFKNLIKSSNNLFRHLPIGKESMDIINPIFDLTSGNAFNQFGEEDNETYNNDTNEQPTPQSGRNLGTIVKRNVSETKKRYVASSQNWKCGNCHSQLSYTYEIDHIKALKDGGDNSVDNLLALCRECHGKKTAESFIK